jgi:cytochrome c oxidase subunit 3
MIKRIRYNYHIIDISPYPIYTALSILTIMISSILLMNRYTLGYIEPKYINIIGLVILSINIYLWWKDIIKEGLYKGEHNNKVEHNLNTGFILFVISEILIFASFFFSYFYNSLIPDIIISSFWPPKGILPINTYSIPLLNTALLFFSGFTITAAQYLININNKKDSIYYIIITLLLAFIFLLLQYFEYKSSSFTINDSIFGSSFFLLTGFHGLHVIIGFLFIFFALIRLYYLHFSSNHYLHLSFSAIYYHFVDIIWIFLFLSLYLWAQ